MADEVTTGTCIITEQKKAEIALKKFLLDIDCLDQLSDWTRRFNLFDVLKISKMEIRHSNMLSWLLNPHENHGLGDSILRGFIHFVVSSFSADEDVFDTLLLDYNDFLIQREWHHIDLLAISPDKHFLLCIENKIDSGEHDNQLNRYRQVLEEVYPAYKRLYIYLSPDGAEASDPDYWCTMSYQDVLNIIESATKKTRLLPDAQLLIDNYIDTIRRDIVGDERLARICAEIYAKHQKALDLIFENRPDRSSELAEIIHAWAEDMDERGLIEYDPEKSGKKYTRFKTKTMSSILPDAPEPQSGWGTCNHYFYEIQNNDGHEFFIHLALSGKDLSADLRTISDQINEIFPSRQQRTNWQWRTHFASHHSKADEDLSKEKIFEQLNRQFKEVQTFEAKLQDALKKTGG